MEQSWFKLDNAAKIYPAVGRKEWAPIFRVSCVLKEPVDPQVLDEALKRTYRRFPSFSVGIKKGLFWYYFEANQTKPSIKKDDRYPTVPFSEDTDQGYLFRVVYYNKRVALEVFHSITDGYGAMVFLKSLMFTYYLLIQENIDHVDFSDLESFGILYDKDLPRSEETEDSFQHYALKNTSLKLKEDVPYKVQGTRIKKHTLKMTHVITDLEAVKKLAKSYNTTITQFVVALYIYAISKERSYISTNNKLIKVSVPVNLRQFFPSNTLRNFSSYISIQAQPEDNQSFDFQGLCDNVKKQMKQGTQPDLLQRKFSGNVNAEKNVITRIAPLILKKYVLKWFFYRYGDRIVTTTVSNMSKIQMPRYMYDLIDRFDVALGFPKNNVINCGVASFDDQLSMTFTSVIQENSVIKSFVDFLLEKDINTKVEANY